jgi:hypothetical protein
MRSAPILSGRAKPEYETKVAKPGQLLVCRVTVYVEASTKMCGVEMWRGGVGAAHRLLALSSPVPQHASVSTFRSSNRMGGFPASGSRKEVHDVVHGKWRGRLLRRTRPSTLCRAALENRLVPDITLCLATSDVTLCRRGSPPRCRHC